MPKTTIKNELRSYMTNKEDGILRDLLKAVNKRRKKERKKPLSISKLITVSICRWAVQEGVIKEMPI